ncbi:MAG: putative cobaltochelatase [Methanosarcinales archaeon]|uniref:Putative cobaltochelatase n=1 Tax=Candidatus Ethanoperedens thermophilum TaxID=2766897 RepID=A0A848D764_9EURY|nr:putative cobaltochelatase [Candidatus Ethanoperedens thermophilum]
MHHLNRQILPFTAIVGQEKMKKALILNAINPRIGGVLIRGEKGTAKSTAVRALTELLPEIEIVNGCPFNCNPADTAEMCDLCYERSENDEKLESATRRTRVIDLPLGCTEDRVVGTLDIEKAIKEGIRALEPGILAAANRGILYIDEVNLLDDHVADVLLDAAAMGANIVEREGISVGHPARFILVGTMNPEEGELRPQLLDRFGLQANVESLSDIDARVKIVKVAEGFEADPAGCRDEFEETQTKLAGKILAAKSLLPDVTISDDLLRTTAEMCIELGVRTHRAEIVITRTAKTIAAFDNRTEVTLNDVKEAMELALPHRMRRKPFEPPELDTDKLDQMMDEKEQEKNEQEREKEKEEEDEKPQERQEQPEHKHEHKHEQEQSEPQDPPDTGDEGEQPQALESVFAIGDPIDVSRVRPKERRDRIHRGKTSGRRIPTLARFNRGRYASHTIPPGKPTDIAIDATIRAAAPHQRDRGAGMAGENAVIIESRDIREKIRVGKVSTATLFVVDASGSMGASNRMESAKGAVMSLLMDSYQQRDRVGMVAFRDNSTDVLLPLCSSVDLAFERLRELPTGGKTPLGAGLNTGLNLLLGEKRRNDETIPIMVLISDGRANVSVGDNGSIKEELLSIAEEARSAGIHVIILDTESVGGSFVKMQLGYCRAIAEHAGGRYFQVNHLSSGEVHDIITHEKEILADICSIGQHSAVRTK